MDSISSSPIYLRWQNAIPLARAHERSGSQKLRRLARAAPSAFSGILASAALVVRSLQPATSPKSDQATKDIEGVTEAMRRSSQALSEIRDFILDKLATGDFRAIGFEIGSAADTPPVEISPRFFRKEWVKWGKDEIRSNNHAFECVRIEVGHLSSKSAMPPKSMTIRPRKMGRPTVLNKIVAVAAGLHESGVLTGKNSQERENAIRDKCRELHPLVFPKPTTPSRPKIYQALKILGLM